MKRTVRLVSLAVLCLVMSAVVCASPAAVLSGDSAEDELFVQNVADNAALYEELSGEGTQENPYLISSSDDWKLFSQNINSGVGAEAYYELECDIDFGGNTVTPVGTAEYPFSGSFDGNGYTLCGFKVDSSVYMGLFGYVRNATLTSFYVCDFTFSAAPTTAPVYSVTKYPTVFVGGAVAFAEGYKGTTTVEKVCVDSKNVTVEAAIKYVFVGGVAGYVNTSVSGKAYINDCYTVSDITLNNTSGYGYVGGIVGRQNTGSASESLVKNCYSTGSFSASGVNSCYASGLSAYLWSHGSSYSPDVGALYAADADTLISHSFAVASVSSSSSKYTSNVGRLVANCNSNAQVDTSTTYYPAAADVSGIVTVSPAKEYTVGTSTALANLKNKDFLADSLLFDFENIWTLDDVGTNPYPVFEDSVRVFDEDTTLSHVEVTTDITLSSGDNVLSVDSINFRNGNSLYFDRGTYVIGEITGDINITAHPNANVIVTGDNKPAEYVEISIGEKSADANLRYAEVSGYQYALREYNGVYGVVTDENRIVEIVEKANAETSAASSAYYYVDAAAGTAVRLSLDSFMNSSDKTDIRLNNPVGIRFRTDISKLSKEENGEFELVEYGFILAAESSLSDGKQLNFDLSKIAYGAAYDKNVGTDIVFDSSSDTKDVVTGVIHNLPAAKYKENICAKPYAKIKVGDDTFLIYGEQMSESLYNIAKQYENDESLSDEQKGVIDSIVK